MHIIENWASFYFRIPKINPVDIRTKNKIPCTVDNFALSCHDNSEDSSGDIRDKGVQISHWLTAPTGIANSKILPIVCEQQSVHVGKTFWQLGTDH
jgi:hypothetical protein